MNKTWKVVKVCWGDHFEYLAEGYEPFAAIEQTTCEAKDALQHDVYIFMRKLEVKDAE